VTSGTLFWQYKVLSALLVLVVIGGYILYCRLKSGRWL